MEECKLIFEKGLIQRKTRETLMNNASSRSHLIFSLIIKSTNRFSYKTQIGKLSFIDLAGSESAKKSGVDKDGLDEMKAIN